MSVKMTTANNLNYSIKYRYTGCTIPYEQNGWRKFTDGLKELQIAVEYGVISEQMHQIKAVASLITGLTTLCLNIFTEEEEMEAELAVKILSALGPLTALSTLQLKSFPAYLGSCLSALPPLKVLTSLDLGHSMVTDDSLRALAPHTGLTGLHMFQCIQDYEDFYRGNETAEGFKTLALLTCLTDLDLFEAPHPHAVTDESLRATLAPLTGLTRLNLSGCEMPSGHWRSLTERGCLAVALAPLTRLTTLLPPASCPPPREHEPTSSSEDDSTEYDYYQDEYDEDE
jgi:hypothetical protein